MNTIVRKITLICVLFLCVVAGFSQASRQLVMEEDADVNSLPRLMLDEFYVHEGIRLEAIDDTGDYLLLCYDDSDSGNIYEEFLWSRRDKKVIKHYYNPRKSVFA